MPFGYHSVYESTFEEGIRKCRELDFDYVQFDLNVPHFFIDQLSQNRLQEIRKLASDNGVAITFHAPGDYVGLTMDIGPIRRGIMEHLKKIIDVAEYLESHHVTLHPLSPPSFKRADTGENEFEEQYLDYYANILAKNLLELDAFTDSIKLGIENYKFAPSVLTGLRKVLAESKHVGLTLDIAKLHKADGKPDPAQMKFFQQYVDHIIELHLHDLRPHVGQHLKMGTGEIEWQNFMPYLQKPEQWMTIEVRPSKYAFQSVEWINDFLQKNKGKVQLNDSR